MSRSFNTPKLFIEGANDTNEGSSIFVKDWRTINLLVATGGNANMTIKFVGSMAETKPDFTAAASQTNPWDYVEVADLEDGSLIDGDTGIAYAGADAVRQFEVNVNGLVWFGALITTYTAGNVNITWVGMES